MGQSRFLCRSSVMDIFTVSHLNASSGIAEAETAFFSVLNLGEG